MTRSPLSFLIALILAVAPSVAVAAEDLAEARHLLGTAKQSPEMAGVSEKALKIASELERTSGELGRLKAAKINQTDPRYRAQTQTLRDLRARLLALQQEVQTDAPSKKIGRRSDEQQKAVNRSSDPADSKDTSQAARDRRKAGLDAIQKLLDIIHQMNPQL